MPSMAEEERHLQRLLAAVARFVERGGRDQPTSRSRIAQRRGNGRLAVAERGAASRSYTGLDRAGYRT